MAKLVKRSVICCNLWEYQGVAPKASVFIEYFGIILVLL